MRHGEQDYCNNYVFDLALVSRFNIASCKVLGQEESVVRSDKKDIAKRVKQTLEALNTLGAALADHGHKWESRERWLYGRAYRWLISFSCDEDSAASG